MAAKPLPLTPAETILRQCLLDCRGEMQSLPGMKDLELRWTGGWVRDKLLHVPSHDIDVALSSMTGMQFGLAMQQFLATHGSRYQAEARRQGVHAEVKDIHKIASNPEKSKHLETVTTRMFGIDVDFVNLRKEVYDDESRNPQMEFGTAEEDAFRRDATVNALFYNLDTQRVEDLTRRGLDDLVRKIMRTPLAPYQTFKDDPLRVLRLIRFACRLGYEIDAESQRAMKDPTIHDALRLKITRERVGIEIGKIMAGPDPHRGLTSIHDLGLYATVFAQPDETDCPAAESARVAYDTLDRITRDQGVLGRGLQVEQHQALSWFLAAYTPWRASSARSCAAARDAIKATNVMSRTLKDSIDLRPAILAAVDGVVAGTATRADVGMTLRQCKDAWRCHVLYSLLCDAADQDPSEVMTKYEKFVDYVTAQALEEAHLMVPVLKGDEIKQALGGAKGGPWLKSAVDLLAAWQFDRREASKEDAVAMLRGKKGQLGLG